VGLITERRNSSDKGSCHYKALCKQIQKLTRQRSRLMKSQKIKRILDDFRGLKFIPRIRAGGKAFGISQMTTLSGAVVSDKHAIAEAFATFYEDLYMSHGKLEDFDDLVSDFSPLNPFTIEELSFAIKHLKRGKARDDSGVFGEFLRDGTDTLRRMVLDVFNDIISFKAPPPATWKCSRLTVIFKKGNPCLPENYRPISILPILYKLFSRMVCERLSPYLVPLQSVH